MARISLPGPTLAPRPQTPQYQRPVEDNSGFQVAKAVSGLGQDVAQASAQYGDFVEKKKLEGRQTKMLERSTALAKRYTDDTQGTTAPSPAQAADAAFEGRDPGAGFFSTRGTRAVEQATGTFEGLKKYATELGADDDEDDRKAWEAVSARMLSGYYDRIEGHASNERERAKLDAVNNATAEAIRAAAMAPADDDAARNNIGRIVAAQDAFVTSPQDALIEAEKVRGAVTRQRLDSLLAKPGGFTDAERVFKENRSSLGALADDYEKRIADAKLGGLAIVEADRILAKGMPQLGTAASANFRMPDEAVMYQELTRLPPELQKQVLPALNQRLALQKAATKEARDAFIDSAVARYNNAHGAFFGTDMARRLNQVDPDKYRSLWNETQTLARRAGDDSAQARREQALDDEALMLAYKNTGELDDRLQVNVDTLAAGSGASPNGIAKVRDRQRQDKEAAQKGLATPESAFVARARASVRGFAPPEGTTPASRAASRAWWAERKAEAVDAFQDWQLDNPGKKLSPGEAAKLQAELITRLPVQPQNQKTLDANVEAVKTLAGRPVVLIGPKGQQGTAAEGAELDKWLAVHPEWKRK